MKIVAAQFMGEYDFEGREYTYYSEVDLQPGDIIRVQAGKGTGIVRISRIDLDDSEISEKVKPFMKTIVTKDLVDAECKLCGIHFNNHDIVNHPFNGTGKFASH